MARRFVLGETTNARLHEVLARTPGARPSGVGLLGQRAVAFVQVTGFQTTLGGVAVWPAVPTSYLTYADGWETYDTCYLKAANGQTLAAGTRYLAVRAGDGVGGRAIFVVPNGGQITYVADVCKVEPSVAYSEPCPMPSTCQELGAFIEALIPSYLFVFRTVDLATGTLLAEFCADGIRGCDLCGEIGSGSGSGGGGGGLIITSCCPTGMPPTIHLTLINVSGCACVAGTYAMTWNGGNWRGTADDVCGTGTGGFIATLDCVGSHWQLQVTVGSIAWVWTLDGSCLPLTLPALAGAGDGGCAAGSTIRGSITV